MPKKYLYVRVSADSQTTENQKLLIASSGYIADECFSEDGVSGTILALNRPEFSRMLSMCSPGDEVCVSALDRLGRNAADILKTVEAFVAMKVKLRIHAMDNLDVTSLHGKMFIGVLACLAELERGCIVERVKSGLARTKNEGMLLGRSCTLHPDILQAMCNDREAGMTISELADKYPNVPRATIHRNVKAWSNNLEAYSKEWAARASQATRQKAKKIAAINMH